MTRNTLSYAIKRQCEDILREHCKKDGDYAVFDDGWDDSRVASFCATVTGQFVTKRHIKNLRSILIGKVRDYQVNKPLFFDGLANEMVIARIETLEKRVAYLESNLGVDPNGGT